MEAKMTLYSLSSDGKRVKKEYTITDSRTFDLEELLKDENFSDYIEGKNKPLVELYEKFNNLKNQFRTNAIDVAKQTIANANATPGSLGSGSEMEVNYESMSSEEFEKVIQGVIDGDIK